MTNPTSIDGITTNPATATDLATFKLADQQLNGFAVPKLYDATNPHLRVFFVLSDGTGNDVINDLAHATNVGLIKGQLDAIKTTNPQIGVGYLAGPGTQGGILGFLDTISGGTYEQRVETMYDQLGAQTKIWKQEDPAVVVRVIEIGFSRGGVQAVGVSNLVDQRGIQDPSGKQSTFNPATNQTQVSYSTSPLIAQGQVAQALGLYDPVGTGVPTTYDLQPSSSVISGFQITAGSEKRSLFPSTSVIDQGSQDPRFLGVTTAGAHSDDGGGYLLNGLSTLNFNLMAKYINGLMGQDGFIQKIVPSVDPVQYVIHKSEEHLAIYRALPQRETIYQLNSSGAQDAKPVNASLAQQFEYSKIGGVFAPGIPFALSAPNSQFQSDPIFNNLTSIAAATGVPVDALLAANPGLSANMTFVTGTMVNLSPITNTLSITVTPTAGTSQTGVTGGGVESDGAHQISAVDANQLNNDQTTVNATGQVVQDNTQTAGNAIAAGYQRPGDETATNGSIDTGALADAEALAYLGVGLPDPLQLGVSLADLDFGGQLTLPTDPLVLDLNGDGVKLTSFDTSPVLFDIDNDGGSLEQTGWVSAQDGILVQDLNGDGKINNIRETLSEYYNGVAGSNGTAGSKPFTNGFTALKSLDTNSDNTFTSADTAWNSLRVWVDANHDGKTDAGELKTFAELGITAINLNSTSQSGEVRDGNEVLARGTFTKNGTTQEAIAANFVANPFGNLSTSLANGILVTTQGDANTGTGKTYVSTSLTGETINLDTIATAANGSQVDNAYGGIGNDTLNGNSLNNWLAGGRGSDVFNAGAGNDVLLVDSEDLQQNIHAGSGFDIVQVIGNGGVTLNLAQAEAEVAQGIVGVNEFDAVETIKTIASCGRYSRAGGSNDHSFRCVTASNSSQWRKSA